jgi:hypothetical protein
MRLALAVTLAALAAAVTLVPASSGQSGSGPAVTIDYRSSVCKQLPLEGKGIVRFFIREVNHTNREANFGKQIRAIWLRTDGWKDSWMNTIDGTDKVPPRIGKTFYADFGADPTKLILRCALKIQGDDRIHNVRVVR